MDIQKNLTLQEKQKFWAEQLQNFESKYWLPSHFEFLAFDMDQGNYTIKDDLDPSFEDDATEIWHRVNTGWAMWKKAINFSKPHEGFVLVPKVKSGNFSEKLDDYLDDLWKSSCGFDDGFVSVSEINHDKIWSLVTEAQEQSHEK